MGLRTALTDMFGIDHPVVLAPMGGVAGGVLAGAVSDGGGLGVIGAGAGDRDWLTRECALARAATRKPWGIGFLSWAIDAAVVEAALEQSPAVIMLSFGDPSPFVDTIRSAGIPVIVQVTDLTEARQALDAGADVVVAPWPGADGPSRPRHLCRDEFSRPLFLHRNELLLSGAAFHSAGKDLPGVAAEDVPAGLVHRPRVFHRAIRRSRRPGQRRCR